MNKDYRHFSLDISLFLKGRFKNPKKPKMSVGEGRREGSCDVSDKIENNFGFEGHIIDFEELLNKNQNTLGLGSLGYCGVIWQA